MHKLKNKHTGEVITTPYMSEALEYLNSGDYEMSDKKYPYIGECENGVVLFVCDSEGFVLAKSKGAWLACAVGGFYADWQELDFENITREYLTNTYGKCESQEHADFICKLAEASGFDVQGKYEKERHFFNFYENILDFWEDESTANMDGEKQTSLPLPPKESKMPEEKPVYTKEMHERGEFKIGMIYLNSDNQKCELKGVNRKSFIGEFVELLVNDDHLDISLIHECKPIPTIEDELIKLLRETPHLHPEARVRKMLELYNITPK